MTLSLAEAGFFRPRWSREVIIETERAICEILKGRGDPDHAANAQKHCAAITRAFPEATVDGYAELIPAIKLPDENDRHVVAAAIQARASVVVTNNIKHFPAEYLATFHLEPSTADDFLSNVIDLYTPGAVAALRTMRQRFKRPELDAETLLRRMEAAGLTQTANLLIAAIESL
jgi:hypothetical protein